MRSTLLAASAILTAAALITMTVGQVARGQTETPSPAAEATPVLSPTAAATPTALSAESFRVSFTLRAEVVDGRRQEIPDGTELVFRTVRGTDCARIPIDAAAVNRGETVSPPVVSIAPSAGCEEGALLLIKLVFPPGFGIGSIDFYSTELRPGETQTIDLVIPAPIPIPSSGPGALPPTGGGSSSSPFGAPGLAGMALVATGLMLLLVATARRART